MSDPPASETTSVTTRIFDGIMFLLRVAIGWHFLYEGVAKLFTPGWTSAGYLEVSRWIFADFFQWLAADPATLRAVDFLNIWGLILIGLALMLGFLTRAASLAGALLLGLYYVCNPPFIGLNFGLPTEGNYLIVDKNLVELLALLLLAAFPAARLPGLDAMLFRRSLPQRVAAPAEPAALEAPPLTETAVPELGRRELVRNLAGIPFLGAFGLGLTRKNQWASYEEKNLVDAVTSASVKTFGIGAHKIETIRGCVQAGLEPDFWMKTLHHLNYWSAREKARDRVS